jgi:phospholipid transport system substrate-binding protein
MKTVFRIILAGVTLLLSHSLLAAELAPDKLVQTVAEEVLKIIREDKTYQNDRKKLVELADAKVLPYFDFPHMTRLVLGKNWRTATPEQQKQLTAEFRTLLVNTYSNALSSYKNQKFEVKPLNMKAGDTEVEVKSVIKQPGGESIPVDYTMDKQGEAWKVFDIKVDGVSLVQNYRSSFNQTIQQSGIDELIKQLADKNRANMANKK